MKLSVSNKFDVSQIADTQTFQETEEFFDFFNSFVSDVVQAFAGNITLTDNIDCKFLPLSMKHGTPVNLGIVNPAAVLFKTTNAISSYELQVNNDSKRQLVVRFKAPQNVRARAAIWQAGTVVRYLISESSAYSAGDVVKIAGFGTASNNGTFLVTEVDTDNDYLYVINRFRTSATGDESRTSYVGSPLQAYTLSVALVNG